MATSRLERVGFEQHCGASPRAIQHGASHQYIPQPISTHDIELHAELLELAELLAERPFFFKISERADGERRGSVPI